MEYWTITIADTYCVLWNTTLTIAVLHVVVAIMEHQPEPGQAAMYMSKYGPHRFLYLYGYICFTLSTHYRGAHLILVLMSIMKL